METKIDFNKVNIQNFDLQIFAAEPVQGSKIMYLVRVLEDLTKEAAMILAFQTEGSTSISKDADNVVTKSGSVRVPGGAEIEITLNALFAKGVDDKINMYINDEINMYSF
uniref:phage major tail protein, TP901-1 family n=2 Tax=Dubosiella newyorkensis TaxID=1862672 RepID=UPI00272AADEE